MHRLIIVTISALLSVFVYAQEHKFQVLEKASGISIPHVGVKVDQTGVTIGDENGYISLDIDPNVFYTLSQVGYSPLTINGEKLLKLQYVKLEEDPIFLDAAIIRADEALFLIKEAVKATHALIPEPPFYIKCIERHSIKAEDSIVIFVNKVTVSKVKRILKPGSGVSHDSKEISYEASDSLKTKMKELGIVFQNLSVPFINHYIVPNKKGILDFSLVEKSDTSFIIGSKPPPKYVPSKRFVTTSGRTRIKDNKIERIDRYVEPRLIELMNEMRDVQYQVMTTEFSFYDDGVIKQVKCFALCTKNEINYTYTAICDYELVDEAEFNRLKGN